jgi:hypothetical protein
MNWSRTRSAPIATHEQRKQVGASAATSAGGIEPTLESPVTRLAPLMSFSCHARDVPSSG